MKQFIRYLYEYEHGKRVRNTGFVKVEQGEKRCVIHIYGKGFSVVNEKALELFLFYMEHRRCIGIPQGEIDKIGPGINYRLEYEVEDVGNEDIFNNIKGIIISNHSNHKYAAVWDDTPIDADEMIVRRDPPRLQEAMEEKVLADVQERMEEAEDPEPPEPFAEEPKHQEQSTEETLEEEPDLQAEQVLPDAPDKEQPGITYEKIRREDLSKLPRKEWRLANNHFLLHGYHNYKHLLLITENEYVFLGVPGVFHEREQQAAKAFGFPQFHRLESPGIALSPEEINEADDFGYWCRQVEQFRV